MGTIENVLVLMLNAVKQSSNHQATTVTVNIIAITIVKRVSKSFDLTQSSESSYLQNTCSH